MTRMVSFRVSEREFEELRSKSEATGARSVSDYARLALCSSSSHEGDRPDAAFHELTDGLRQLRVDVRRLTDLLEDHSTSSDEDSLSSKQNRRLGKRVTILPTEAASSAVRSPAE